MSSTSAFFNLTLTIYLLHESFYLCFCLPFRIFTGTGGACSLLLNTCPSSRLLTCPYHFSLFSVLFFVTGATFTDPLTCFVSDFIFRRDSTHASQHPHLVHLQSWLFVFDHVAAPYVFIYLKQILFQRI